MENERKIATGRSVKPEVRKRSKEEKDALLNRFYRRMAAPSERNLVRISKLLNKFTPMERGKLLERTFRKDKRSVTIWESTKIGAGGTQAIEAGKKHMGCLLQAISNEEIILDKPRGLDSDAIKTLAQREYERLLRRNKEDEIIRMASEVKNETDLVRRSRLGEVLSNKLGDSELSNGFFPYNMWIYDVAVASSERLAFQDKLECLPKKDKAEFNRLRIIFGAKAANLIMLQGAIEDVNILYEEDDPKLRIPEFHEVPASLYVEWKSGKSIDKKLEEYFKKVQSFNQTDNTAGVIVRSSAVHSEDGERVTGAGIYDSVPILYEELNFNKFKSAVIDVYKSTDSAKAVAYRREHGIKDEQMGLILQNYLLGDNEGYLNTQMPGVPGLTEISTRKSRNFVKHKELDFYLASFIYAEGFKEAHHFPPDNYRVVPQTLLALAQRASILERVWGNNIQLEFVTIDDAFGRAKYINLVQIRDIPAFQKTESKKIVFPKTKPLHMDASIGIGDMKLNILSTHENNSDKTGVVVLAENEKWSIFGDERVLPEKGAVVIQSSWGANGHIQTLCAEKGIVCIFPGDLSGSDYQGEKPRIRHYKKFIDEKQVRVVSNGLEARVYRTKKTNNLPDNF